MPVLGPLVAYVQSPRDSAGKLLEEPLYQLIANALDAGVDAITVLGSVGGAAYMPRSMRKKVISKVVSQVDGKIPVLAGVGALTTAEISINLTEAAEAGATGALLQPMAYQPLLPHEVLYLYEQVNAVSPIPLWVYNNPATTRHTFTLNELAQLAAFDKIAGFKDRAASGNELKRRIDYVAQALPEMKAVQFNWGFSGETKGALVLGAGGHSWHSALAGVLPAICVELARAAVAGRTDPEIAAYSQAMQRALSPLTVTMTQYGGVRVAHAVAEQTGIAVGTLPLPLRTLPPAVYSIVQMALESIDKTLAELREKTALNVSSENSERDESLAPEMPLEPVTALQTRAQLRTGREVAVTPRPQPSLYQGGVHSAPASEVASQEDPHSRWGAETSRAVADRSRHALPQTDELPSAPVRVSAREQVRRAEKGTDLTRIAENMLLTGDPELDSTRVNLQRVEAPLLEAPPGDRSNYVPRRAL